MHSNPQREYVRHTVDVPLQVSPVHGGAVDDGAALAERSLNVSHGGLAFTSECCLATGELVELRIPTVKPPFEARARVAWCRPEADGRYLVGVQFLDSADAFQSRMVQQVCAIESYRREVAEREGRRLSTEQAAAEWIGRYAGRFPVTQEAGDG